MTVVQLQRILSKANPDAIVSFEYTGDGPYDQIEPDCVEMNQEEVYLCVAASNRISVLKNATVHSVSNSNPVVEGQ